MVLLESTSGLLQTVFTSQGPAPWSIIVTKSVVLYAYGLLLARVGKSRPMGNATALDVIVVIVLGSLLSRGINGAASLASTMVASAALVGCHWLCTWATARSHAVGNFVKGHARLIVADGQMDLKTMRRSHLSPEDLREEMRLNGNVDEIAAVHRAYKERNGQISVVRQPAPPGGGGSRRGQRRADRTHRVGRHALGRISHRPIVTRSVSEGRTSS